uniref:CCHC-type domain-containing protein n=1 Tax=Anopheles atroparvus TaxID=41427 RepID=A0AAG5CQI3_ANOAO
MEGKCSMEKFDTTDLSTIAVRWKKWMRSFELFAEVAKVTGASAKKANLLHYAGLEVLEIFFNIEGNDAAPAEGSDVYKDAKTLLDNHFNPMKNLVYERSKFRSIVQGEDAFEKFVLKLKQQADLCEYTNQEERMVEQIFDKANSNTLRERMLQKKMTSLQEVTQLGQSLEMLEIHREKSNSDEAAVNKVKSSRIAKKPSASMDNFTCYRCGRRGHIARDAECPAKDEVCNKCGVKGHFKSRCKSEDKRKDQRKGKGRDQVRCVQSGSDDSEDEECVQYVFATDAAKEADLKCTMGGVKLNWIVDSGAGVNVIDWETWKSLKRKEVDVIDVDKNPKMKLKRMVEIT